MENKIEFLKKTKNNELRHLSNRLKSLLKNRHAIAIYGTGLGADILTIALQDISYNVVGYIERDELAEKRKENSNYSIFTIDEIIDNIDTIIISARTNHSMVLKRVQLYLKMKCKDVDVIDIYGDDWNSTADYITYVKYLESYKRKYEETFVPYKKYEPIDDEDIKLIAWYLPQYYQMHVNDVYHGKGYTEWTSTTQAMPVYTGQYQPHIPFDLGYYSLLDPDIIRRQVDLANNYGIYGFCMHYYWFNGKRVMTKPADIIMKNKDINFKFFFNWANENWTTKWTDNSPDVIFSQSYPINTKKFMDDIIPYMKDCRYIRIDNKPVLSIYRCNLFGKEECIKMLRYFRKRAKFEGFDDLYILATTASDIDYKATEWGFDSMVEFPPWNLEKKGVTEQRPDTYISPNFIGNFYDTSKFLQEKKYLDTECYCNCFKSVMLSYDNTARRSTTGAGVYMGLNPETYKIWLEDIIQYTRKNYNNDEKIVFLNSWNEWGEGQHLEPDMKYGYAYLQATREAIAETR